MALLSFESPDALVRIKQQLVMVDTSYLIALSDEDDRHSKSIRPFHEATSQIGTVFILNSVVRQEFINNVRKNLLIEVMLDLASNDSTINQRYKNAARLSNKALSRSNLKHAYEQIYKDHVQKGDYHILTDAITRAGRDIWAEVRQVEEDAGIEYISGSNTATWDDLGSLMTFVCMTATDCMIANMALSVGADAIASADCDYACLSPVIDIYIPETIFKQIV